MTSSLLLRETVTGSPFPPSMEIVSVSFNFSKRAQARGKLGKPLAFVQGVWKQIFFFLALNLGGGSGLGRTG